MGAMRTHNLWKTPTVHVIVYHVPEYVRRTGVPLGGTSEQALEIQRRFSIFAVTDCKYEIPRLSRQFTKYCIAL